MICTDWPLIPQLLLYKQTDDMIKKNRAPRRTPRKNAGKSNATAARATGQNKARRNAATARSTTWIN